jgi:hypothetical protein
MHFGEVAQHRLGRIVAKPEAIHMSEKSIAGVLCR